MNPRATPILLLPAALAACLALSACARDDGAAAPPSAAAGDADAAQQSQPAPGATTDTTADAAAAMAPDPAAQPAPAANDDAPDAMADAAGMGAGAGGQWQYGSEPAEGGDAATARIAGSTDSGRQVALVFADDPTWGGTAKIEGLPGPIECPDGCRVGIAIDGGAQTSVPASRPASASEPVLSLRKPRDLWRDLGGARELQLTLPDGSIATFQVSGLDTGRLPGLD